MDTALFILSKLVLLLIQPSSVLVAATALGMIWAVRRPGSRCGLRLAALGLMGLLVAGLSPLSNVFIVPLENRFPRPSLEDLGTIRGLIILGGFEDTTGERGGGLGLNESAERITEAARLARLMPQLDVVFTGGVGNILRSEVAQDQAVGRWLVDMGVAKSRILLEGRSRTTWENATMTRELLGPRARGRWVLVTSAWHMPRAIGVFRKAGFDVVAWPTDYRTTGAAALARGFDSVPDGLRRLDFAIKEWLGLASYWALGRTTSLYPAP